MMKWKCTTTASSQKYFLASPKFRIDRLLNIVLHHPKQFHPSCIPIFYMPSSHIEDFPRSSFSFDLTSISEFPPGFGHLSSVTIRSYPDEFFLNLNGLNCDIQMSQVQVLHPKIVAHCILVTRNWVLEQ